MNTIGLYVYRCLSRIIPETRGFGLKRSLLRMCGARIGKNVRICSSAFILGPGELEIGDGTWVGQGVFILSASRVKIGSRVDIAPGVYIATGTHCPEPYGSRMAGEGLSLPITVGDGCWLCARCVLLPGVDVGEMSLVAAGALVKDSMPAHSFVAGVPAKVNKRY